MILPRHLRTLTEWLFIGPMGPIPAANLENLPQLAVDGGAHFSIQPKVWVGDADSVNHEVQAEHLFKHSIDKDQSDLALALNLFTDNCHYKFHLWGFLGGRKDHELFNLGESFHFLENHHECQILLYDSEGNIRYHLLSAGIWKFSHHGLFSLGTLKKTALKMTGQCQYQIPKTTPIIPLSSVGLSNYGQGEIMLETEGTIFLYFPEGE